MANSDDCDEAGCAILVGLVCMAFGAGAIWGFGPAMIVFGSCLLVLAVIAEL
jgi:hypothetical protein